MDGLISLTEVVAFKMLVSTLVKSVEREANHWILIELCSSSASFFSALREIFLEALVFKILYLCKPIIVITDTNFLEFKHLFFFIVFLFAVTELVFAGVVSVARTGTALVSLLLLVELPSLGASKQRSSQTALGCLCFHQVNRCDGSTWGSWWVGLVVNQTDVICMVRRCLWHIIHLEF